jgi:hypothetical protein
VDADSETKPIEAACARLVFSMCSERRADATSAVCRPHLHILKLRGIGQREVRVPDGLSIAPRDEIHPIALVQTRQAEDSGDRLDLTWSERMDVELDVGSLVDPEWSAGAR